MLGLGFGELVLIFLIALIFIGPKKLPELAKGLGQGIKEFQKAAKGLTDQLQDSGESNTTQSPPKIVDATVHHEEKAPEVTTHESKDKTQA